MTKKLFTTKEIMNLLGLAQPTISKYVKKGMPVAGKVDFGKGNVYDLKDVTDWIKENTKYAVRPNNKEVIMMEDLPFDDGECEKYEYESDLCKHNTNAGKILLEGLTKSLQTRKDKPFSTVKPKVFKHRDMPVYVREDLHDKVKREALRHNVTMKKLVEDIVAYHLEVKI